MTSAIPWPFNEGTTEHNLQREGEIKREIKKRERKRATEESDRETETDLRAGESWQD